MCAGTRCACTLGIAIVVMAPLAAVGAHCLWTQLSKDAQPGQAQQSALLSSSWMGIQPQQQQEQQQRQEQQPQSQEQQRPLAPLMVPQDQKLFQRLLDESTTYFEWGAGGSTEWAVQSRNIKKIHTVENTVEWVKILKQRVEVQEAQRMGRLSFSPIDLGPVGEFAYPLQKDPASQARWATYSDELFKTPERHYDLIMVDGRFRVACALKTLQFIRDRTTTRMIIHDYEREHYHQVEEFADVVERAVVLAVFRKKEGIDEEKLKAAVLFHEKELLL